MKIGVAGDWHGSFDWTRGGLATLGERGIKHVFHAGDFSIAFNSTWPDLINISERVCKHYDMQLYVTPGNHENWDWIDAQEFGEDGLLWVSKRVAICARNAVIEIEGRKILSLGGATSVDRSLRVPHSSWWPTEEITEGDLIRLQDVKNATGEIDIMVCHDAPGGGTDAVQAILNIPPHLSIFPTEGIIAAGQHRKMMEAAFEIVQPKVFVHGHFHAPDMKQVGDTLFMSMGCNNQPRNIGTIDLDDLSGEMFDVDRRLFDKRRLK